VRDHVHAFEHGLAVVLDQDRYHALSDQPDRRVGVIIENDRLLQMQPLERGRHPHAETKRAVLEHKEPHDTRSFLDVPFEERAMGRQEPGAPRQQFSVRKAMSPFIAS
jgi:hypothetical protein